MDGEIFGKIFGWKNVWMDQDVGGAVAPACVVPEETSINIDGQDFGHQLVDCPTQSLVLSDVFICQLFQNKCNKVREGKTQQDILQWLTDELCGSLAFTFKNNERQDFGLLGKIKCTAPHEYKGQA